VREIQSFLPEDGVLVSETGHATMWTGAYMDLRPRQMYLRAAGTLGWAFPASVGVKCALPDRTVVCFTGDGGFYYHLSELETAVRYGANVLVVVNNNSSMSQEMGYFESAYGGAQTESARKMWRFREIDFAKIAEGMGCAGYRVESASDIGPALQEATAAGRPAVIDVVSDMMALGDSP
jgi:acetolactate synthase-1/2/3 large subunit